MCEKREDEVWPDLDTEQTLIAKVEFPSEKETQSAFTKGILVSHLAHCICQSERTVL